MFTSPRPLLGLPRRSAGASLKVEDDLPVAEHPARSPPATRRGFVEGTSWGSSSAKRGGVSPAIRRGSAEAAFAPILVCLLYSSAGMNSPRPYPMPAPSASGPVTGFFQRTDMCWHGY